MHAITDKINVNSVDAQQGFGDEKSPYDLEFNIILERKNGE